MALTDLYVLDKESHCIHKLGDQAHDGLYVMNGEIRYYNLQNGDGGGVRDEDGCGYVILESDAGFLEDEFGIIDKRFEKEIRAYLSSLSPSPSIDCAWMPIKCDTLGDCNSSGNAGETACSSCTNGSRYIKKPDSGWRK